MTLYVIGVGGSGAKCIESLVQVASTGLFSEQSIKLLFVDADETNGNLERSRNCLNAYNRCNTIMSGGKQQQCSWMKTKIESLGLWSPFADYSVGKDLKSVFHYNTLKQNQPALGNLFDVLYTEEERTAKLDVGFRGRPAIGSAVMSQVDLDRLDQEPWGSLVKQIQTDTGSGTPPKILLFGSIFGGTGASGLPTIARLITNKLEKLNVRQSVKISCLFMLPFFGFSAPPGEDPDGVYARSEQFLLNTEAALRYYCGQGQEIFDTVYLLGNQKLSPVDFSIGKNTQRNAPHFLELYAALAAQHFLEQPSEQKDAVVLLSREQIGTVNWSDIPDRNRVQPLLVDATRFTYFWLTEIAPELAKASQAGLTTFIREAPWLKDFYRVRGGNLPDLNAPEQQTMITEINNWCQTYLGWLRELHQCEGEIIDLFNTTSLINPKEPIRDALHTLVRGDTSGVSKQAAMNPARIKQRLDPKRVELPNQGTVGLAKAVYHELSN